MNSILAEMRAVLEGDSELLHYGMPRRSGRYPWGSGKDPYQRTTDFLGRVEELKRKGWTETPENIKKEFGITTTEYRIEKRLCKNERRMLQVARAKSLREDGKGYTEIGREMGISESSVRSLLTEKSGANMIRGKNTADFIKEQMKTKGMVDIGTSVEHELGVTKETLDEAVYLLKREGYTVRMVNVEQINNPGNYTRNKVLCPPGTEYKDVYNFEDIKTLKEYTSRDGGETFSKFQYPASMDSSRMRIRYAEDGGVDRDGIVELRRGVPDLSLGDSKYSQVRILVDGDRYIKGMAVYSDDMPDGVDVIFNTNKHKVDGDGNPITLREVLKDTAKNLKKDPDNPFGSAIKANGQSTYFDKDGNEHLSLINKRADEGDWTDWKDTLPSQFLSKQPYPLAKKQLDLAKTDSYDEYSDICSVQNPTLKKHLLDKFASECDSAAVHLKAAALPGQKYHVIIPINSLGDKEIYAPQYENGTKLALIRYPHGGIFEIPILTVNNKNPDGNKIISPQSIDAVGINKHNADRLSGADFDGDTVMCIPTHDRQGKVKIASSPELDGLKGFDSKMYQYDSKTEDADGTEHYFRNGVEFKRMRNTQTEMGIISNLITDMTLKGADTEELSRAVKHSMVVIDAEKHCLDYKQSAFDNNIAALKKEYQDGGGASTIISRSKSETSVDKRQGTPTINVKGRDNYDPSKPEGALIYKTADDLYYTKAKMVRNSKEPPNSTIRVSAKGKTYIQMDGDDNWTMIDGKVNLPDGTRVKSDLKTFKRTQQSTKMAETDDAYSLVSDGDYPMERLYADYANSMKSLANQARKEMVSTGNLKYDATAKKAYQAEVASLNEKLKNAQMNAPRERQAQRMANAELKAKKEAYEQEHGEKMKPADAKKIGQQAITKYRNEVGAIKRSDRSIKITDREWEAIQAGAITENTLVKILNNTDIADLRQRATPYSSTTLRPSQISKIKAMSASNYSLKQIAESLGVSTSTVNKYLKGGN